MGEREEQERDADALRYEERREWERQQERQQDEARLGGADDDG